MEKQWLLEILDSNEWGTKTHPEVLRCDICDDTQQKEAQDKFRVHEPSHTHW